MGDSDSTIVSQPKFRPELHDGLNSSERRVDKKNPFLSAMAQVLPCSISGRLSKGLLLEH